jgi:hypothetical protein
MLSDMVSLFLDTRIVAFNRSPFERKTSQKFYIYRHLTREDKNKNMQAIVLLKSIDVVTNPNSEFRNHGLALERGSRQPRTSEVDKLCGFNAKGGYGFS